MNALSEMLIKIGSVLSIFLLPQAPVQLDTVLLRISSFLKHVVSLASPECRPSPASLALLSGALQMTGVGLCKGNQGRVSPAVRWQSNRSVCVAQTLGVSFKNLNGLLAGVRLPGGQHLRRSHVGLSATPCIVARQAPPSMGSSRQEHWSGLPFPPPKGSSQPRNRTRVSYIAGRFFTFWATFPEGNFIISIKPKNTIQHGDHPPLWWNCT